MANQQKIQERRFNIYDGETGQKLNFEAIPESQVEAFKRQLLTEGVGGANPPRNLQVRELLHG